MKLHISNEIFLWFGLFLFGIAGFFLTIFVPPPAGFYAFVLVASVGGFGVAAYIWYTKSRGKQLVCPAGGDCNAVVTSKYSKFLGVKLEYLGMLYFTVMLAVYSILAASQFFPNLPDLLVGEALVGVVLLTVAAAMFSIYLLFVQAALLKKWCIWCVLASLFSLTVFFMSLISLEAALTFLEQARPVLEGLTAFGYVLGMGGVTAAVFLFIRFLRDLDINEKELDTINDMAQIIWLGMGMTVMSQFALYVANPALAESGLFLAQILALFAAAFAGVVLMILYRPFLVYVPFSKIEEGSRLAGFAALRRPSALFAAVALSSWYFAFATNFLPELGLAVLLAIYAAGVVLALGAGMAWEWSVSRKEPLEQGEQS